VAVIEDSLCTFRYLVRLQFKLCLLLYFITTLSLVLSKRYVTTSSYRHALQALPTPFPGSNILLEESGADSANGITPAWARDRARSRLYPALFWSAVERPVGHLHASTGPREHRQWPRNVPSGAGPVAGVSANLSTNWPCNFTMESLAWPTAIGLCQLE
jgi:hypothetical protein